MLIDKIASNQSWKGERQPARPRGVHQIDTVDMLAIKLELLMKKLESPHQEVNQVSESRMTCETCGETGHSGSSCPLTQEDAKFIGTNNVDAYQRHHWKSAMASADVNGVAGIS